MMLHCRDCWSLTRSEVAPDHSAGTDWLALFLLVKHLQLTMLGCWQLLERLATGRPGIAGCLINPSLVLLVMYLQLPASFVLCKCES